MRLASRNHKHLLWSNFPKHSLHPRVPHRTVSAFRRQTYVEPTIMAQQPWNVTFLGTSSGGGPSTTRNCSSLVADVCYDGSLWMVDCAEGTIRQFDFQPNWGGPRVTPHQVKKLFVTHMHADHTMGIITFLRRILYTPDHSAHEAKQNPKPAIEIFGPSGIRRFVRFILQATLTKFPRRYVVHELLTSHDPVTSCDPNEMHESEISGRDILHDRDGFWRGITKGVGSIADILVDAGSIQHRDPCIGYVIREGGDPGRQIVALGDTYDATAMIPLCNNPSLVIHEATDAFVHPSIKRDEKRTEEKVIATTLEKGHSLPNQAGDFARKVGAQSLILNHISGRFPSPNKSESPRAAVIGEIERQATEAWSSGYSAAVAYDYMSIKIPVPPTWRGGEPVREESYNYESRSFGYMEEEVRYRGYSRQ